MRVVVQSWDVISAGNADDVIRNIPEVHGPLTFGHVDRPIERVVHKEHSCRRDVRRRGLCRRDDVMSRKLPTISPIPIANSSNIRGSRMRPSSYPFSRSGSTDEVSRFGQENFITAKTMRQDILSSQSVTMKD